MKNLMFLAFIFICFSSQAQTKNPKQLVIDFFEAFHEQDTVKLKTFATQSLQLKSVSMNVEGKTTISTSAYPEFVKSIASIPKHVKFEEKIHEYRIEENGLLATVATPYTFFYNGEKSHCGTNVFNLVKLDGNWKILFLMDSRSKQACD
ncbi:hypothetical protein JM79_1265 [Gramella sp. Hel_I_59]|uniref:nuclear transport factor 2 family protein n=1 Tax=Gramella sp. Hel_I_59 TaxID=1249978 RepID=UPI00115051C2|nr:nuclear transport factor 2 family protein [Gramella sp. Hel_I_59]TQI70355.1 hypothetical protein JM79_1265 [Gramella sp. Hel_I_59]